MSDTPPNAPSTPDSAPPATEPPDALTQAALDLGSPVRPVREQAERTLLQAKQAAVPHLIAALSAPVPEGGQSPVGRIALFLGALQDRSALPALYDRVFDAFTDPEAKSFIARALAELLDGRDAFDDRATEALEILSRDDDKFTRAFAAQAYGALGDARSKARIEALTADPDSWVRSQADKTLRKLLEQEAAAAAPTLEDFAALANQAQAEGGRLKPWLDDLGDDRRSVRDAAVAQLVAAGQEAVPFLVEKLNQPQALPRIGAAQALGRIQSAAATAPLLIAATTAGSTKAERELRPVALRALANCLTGTEEGLAESLLPLARDDDRFVRAGALLCLGRIADRAGIHAVVDALTDPEPFVVESASIALSEGIREDDIDLVLPLLEVFDAAPARGLSALHEAILIALSRIQIEAAPLRVRVRHRVRRELTGQTAATRKAAMALLDRLHSADDPPVLPVLDAAVALLRDGHPEVRVVAASFLATHLEPGFTGATERLRAAIARDERTLSLLCLEALHRHATAASRAVLEATTANPDSAVATRAAELVERFPDVVEEWRFEPKRKAPDLEPATRPAPRQSGRVRPVTTSADVVEAKPADVVEAKTADVVEAKTADLVEAKTAGVVEAKTADVVEAKAADVVEAKAAIVVETKPADTQPGEGDVKQPDAPAE